MHGSQWSHSPQPYSPIPTEMPTATNKKFLAMQICFAFISCLGSWNIVMSDFQLLLKNMLAFRITKENVTEMTQEHSAVRHQIKKKDSYLAEFLSLLEQVTTDRR